jgi:hypothetical protein
MSSTGVQWRMVSITILLFDSGRDRGDRSPVCACVSMRRVVRYGVSRREHMHERGLADSGGVR